MANEEPEAPKPMPMAIMRNAHEGKSPNKILLNVWFLFRVHLSHSIMIFLVYYV